MCPQQISPTGFCTRAFRWHHVGIGDSVVPQPVAPLVTKAECSRLFPNGVPLGGCCSKENKRYPFSLLSHLLKRAPFLHRVLSPVNLIYDDTGTQFVLTFKFLAFPCCAPMWIQKTPVPICIGVVCSRFLLSVKPPVSGRGGRPRAFPRSSAAGVVPAIQLCGSLQPSSGSFGNPSPSHFVLLRLRVVPKTPPRSISPVSNLSLTVSVQPVEWGVSLPLTPGLFSQLFTHWPPSLNCSTRCLFFFNPLFSLLPPGRRSYFEASIVVKSIRRQYFSFF